MLWDKDLAPAEWIGRFTWAGHSITATMEVLCDTCGIGTDAFAAMDAPPDALDMIGTNYLYYREAEGSAMVGAMLKYFSHLAVHAGEMLETAKWLIRESERSEGMSADSIRLALMQEVAVFNEWTIDHEGREKAARYAIKMIKSDTYDIDFLRIARQTDKKIMDWWYGE